MKSQSIIKICFVALLAVGLFSCKKEAGEGGTSSIYGRIYARDWNSNFSSLLFQYYSADEDVYIIYGNDKSYGDKVKSGPNGYFEFKYLRQGNYKVYALAKDSISFSSQLFPIIKEVQITDDDQDVDAGTIVIQK